MILGILDRDYTDFSTFFISLLAGILMSAISIGFRDLKQWGWYGLVVLNGLIVLAVLFNLSDAYNLVYMFLSIGTLAALFARPTKAQIFG